MLNRSSASIRNLDLVVARILLQEGASRMDPPKLKDSPPESKWQRQTVRPRLSHDGAVVTVGKIRTRKLGDGNHDNPTHETSGTAAVDRNR